jgi:hypothetical protein
MKEVRQDLEVKHRYCGDAITLPLLNTTFSHGHVFPFKEAIGNYMWYGTRMGGGRRVFFLQVGWYHCVH